MHFEPQRDVADLESSFRSQLVPAVRAFLANAMTAEQLYEAAERGYGNALRVFDAHLADSFGVSFLAEQSILESPDADVSDSSALTYYPLSIASHNLIRLTEVLCVELHGRTADDCEMPQRLLDLDAVVTTFDPLFASYRAVSLATA